MTLLWIGAVLFVIGLAMIALGGRRTAVNTMNVHGSSGNFIQGIGGDVNIGTSGSQSSKPAGEERFLKWSGFIVAVLGLAVAAAKLWMG